MMSRMEPTIHSVVIEPAIQLIQRIAPSEAEQWYVIECLCLGIGSLHGRTPRQTAEFLDLMAVRIAKGKAAT